MRHHRIRDALEDLHKMAGWRIRKEQVFGAQQQFRMDLVAEDPFDHRHFFLDVSVVDPFSGTFKNDPLKAQDKVAT